MAQPETFKQFIKWLEVYSPADWEVMTPLQNEKGTSVWIRFDLDRGDDYE